LLSLAGTSEAPFNVAFIAIFSAKTGLAEATKAANASVAQMDLMSDMIVSLLTCCLSFQTLPWRH
jgi:hypothetical protein